VSDTNEGKTLAILIAKGYKLDEIRSWTPYQKSFIIASLNYEAEERKKAMRRAERKAKARSGRARRPRRR